MSQTGQLCSNITADAKITEDAVRNWVSVSVNVVEA